LRNKLSKGALLLDCHSFPSYMGDVDICIGYNDDWSKPASQTIEYAVNLFEENGFSVGLNYPYSNSETPECPFTYHSMMLEVNKRVYMEEGSLRLSTKLYGKKAINEVFAQLIERL